MMEGHEEGGEGAKKAAVVVGEAYYVEEERELTVRKTSLFFPDDGFTVYEHHTGDLVFRVDTYGRDPALADQLVLMDPVGASILTVRRKWPSLHQRWEGQRPLFTVRWSSIFGGDRAGVTVEVHVSGRAAEYRVEGSFAQRCCRVLYESREGEVVVEIKRKVDANARVVLGRDVFCHCLEPWFDATFAMGLVLVLDQISGDDDDDGITATPQEDNGRKMGDDCDGHQS